MSAAHMSLAKDEFVRRFVAQMITAAGETFEDGSSIRDYAVDVAPTYWENPEQRVDGPEYCADSDMSYWEA